MKLNDAARELIGNGADATLVTLNPDGSPQVSVVWVALRSTPDGDELVTAHLAEHKKVRNVRRDPRVAVTIVNPGDVGKTLRSYISIDGTARIEEGGAPELLETLSEAAAGPQRVPAEGCAARIRDPHPHRQSRRRRALVVTASVTPQSRSAASVTAVSRSTRNLADRAARAFPKARPDRFLVRLAQAGQRQRVDDLHPLG